MHILSLPQGELLPNPWFDGGHFEYLPKNHISHFQMLVDFGYVIIRHSIVPKPQQKILLQFVLGHMLVRLR